MRKHYVNKVFCLTWAAACLESSVPGVHCLLSCSYYPYLKASKSRKSGSCLWGPASKLRKDAGAFINENSLSMSIAYSYDRHHPRPCLETPPLGCPNFTSKKVSLQSETQKVLLGFASSLRNSGNFFLLLFALFRFKSFALLKNKFHSKVSLREQFRFKFFA